MNEQHHIDKLFSNSFEGFEVNPPENLWDSIVQDIDAAQLESFCKENFENFEVVPSTDVWGRITSALSENISPEKDENKQDFINDDLDIVAKGLFANLEIEPSINIWENIRQTLDEQENDDSIDSLFATELAYISVEPSENNWTKIKDAIYSKEQEDERFDALFRERFEDFEVEPPVETWRKIRGVLPLNLPVKRYLTSASRIAALFVFGLCSYYVYDNYMQVKTEQSLQNGMAFGNEKAKNLGNKSTEAFSKLGSIENSIQNKTIIPVLPEKNNASSSEFTNEESVAKTSYSNKNNTENKSTNTYSKGFVKQNPLQEKTTVFPQDNLNEEIIVKGTPPDDNKKGESYIIREAEFDTPLKSLVDNTATPILVDMEPLRSLHSSNIVDIDVLPVSAFTGAAINQAGILDKVQIEELLTDGHSISNLQQWYLLGFGQAHLSSYNDKDLANFIAVENQLGKVAHFGWASGMGVGYRINSKWGVQLEASVSQQGQKFKESLIDNSQINTEVKNTYIYVPVLCKIKFRNVSANNPAFFNGLIGLNYGRLLNNKTIKNGNEIELSDELLIKNELGITSGLEYDYHFSKNLYLTAGARLSIGKNINDFSDNSSTNISGGVRLGINFQTGKIKK